MNTETRTKTEYRDVTMQDGSTVKFPTKRFILREVVREGDSVVLKVNAVNGEQRSYVANPKMYFNYVAQGMADKFGQEIDSKLSVEDQLAQLDALHNRVNVECDWTKPSEADSFSGTHIVVRAMGNVTGKSREEITEYIERKLEEGKANKLSRQQLYRIISENPRFSAEVAKLEAEAKAKQEAKAKPEVDVSDI